MQRQQARAAAVAHAAAAAAAVAAVDTTKAEASVRSSDGKRLFADGWSFDIFLDASAMPTIEPHERLRASSSSSPPPPPRLRSLTRTRRRLSSRLAISLLSPPSLSPAAILTSTRCRGGGAVSRLLLRLLVACTLPPAVFCGIGCFVCSSFNRSNLDCEDTFNSSVQRPISTTASIYHAPCWCVSELKARAKTKTVFTQHEV